MKKGDIVLLPFPFTDLSGSKKRPAVVLCTNDSDVTVCFITSELKWHDKYDIPIEPNEINGLKVKSLLRINKIATIDIDLIIGELGYLSDYQIHLLNHRLIELLRLR